MRLESLDICVWKGGEIKLCLLCFIILVQADITKICLKHLLLTVPKTGKPRIKPPAHSVSDKSPWGHKELGMTERLHFHFSLSCTGEGNSNPLQCSCLENPRDRGAWWAAIYGVAQSRTRLKQLNSSSSSSSSSKSLVHRQLSSHRVLMWWESLQELSGASFKEL